MSNTKFFILTTFILGLILQGCATTELMEHPAEGAEYAMIKRGKMPIFTIMQITHVDRKKAPGLMGSKPFTVYPGIRTFDVAINNSHVIWYFAFTLDVKAGETYTFGLGKGIFGWDDPGTIVVADSSGNAVTLGDAELFQEYHQRQKKND